MNTEQAFDLLPHVVDIYDKLDLDQYRKDVQKKYKGKKVDQTQVGIDAFKYVLKNSHKVKEEFFQIVAIVEDRPVEEVKRQSFLKTVNSIKKVFTDPELMDFFKQAVE
ncbi:hypothetical protein EDD68_107108 [Melghiribacillus thermohalophilus]|uniref:Uncharacterized protein n=1 Tax=Melghiribacillus thermohalophilus TaxID=1324956 RepID=A0A4R3N3R5_9BACI|nr:hypothetical protein [Melghiribacillus thermohalophilus]TCT23394.1 hypothetical protein EDD68_107108 [Melghiribacillus thermohalophilus]